MSQWRSLLKSSIALFCEGVWLYFALYFLVTVQWGLNLSLSLSSLFLSAGAAYLLNAWLARSVASFGWVFTANIILLMCLVLPLWTIGYEGYLGYALVLSLSAVYLFLRSSFFVYKEPTRTQMVLRFEGNIIFYVLLLLFTYTQVSLPLLVHILLIMAVLFSLVGMLLSLYAAAEDKIETRTVGQAGFLPAVLMGLFITGLLFALLLLIPSVRVGLIALVSKLWAGLTWGFSALLSGLIWLFSLLPEPELGELPPPATGPFLALPEEISQLQGEFPLLWMLAIVLIVVIIAFLWLSSLLIKHWKPGRPIHLRRTKIEKTSFWKRIWNVLCAYVLNLVQHWKRRFPSYFTLPIYWHFYQVTTWARRRGIVRREAETPQEFIQRLIEELSIQEDVQPLFLKLGEAYASTYYSEGETQSSHDFSPLQSYLIDRSTKA